MKSIVTGTYLLVGFIYMTIGLLLMVALLRLSDSMSLWISAPFLVLSLFFLMRAAKPG